MPIATVDHTNKVLKVVRAVSVDPSTATDSQSIPITDSSTHKLNPDYIPDYYVKTENNTTKGIHGLVPSTTVVTGKVLCADGWQDLNTNNSEKYYPNKSTGESSTLTLTTPDYIVGSNQLEIYFNGQKQCSTTIDSTYGTYSENGDEGTISTSITVTKKVFNTNILCRVTNHTTSSITVGFNIKGEFVSGTIYYYGDIVTYNNCSYICKVNKNTPYEATIAPNIDTTCWNKIFDNMLVLGSNSKNLGVINSNALTIESSNTYYQKFSIATSITTLAITMPNDALIGDIYTLYIVEPGDVTFTFTNSITWPTSTQPTFEGALSIVTLTCTAISTSSTTTKWSGYVSNIIYNDRTGYNINYYS